MKICRGCGGVLGIHCWNEIDCINISNYQSNDDRHEIDSLEEYISILTYVMKENNIKIPDKNFNESKEPLIFKQKFNYGCETKIDDSLPF